jgi:hypothetical protein
MSMVLLWQQRDPLDFCTYSKQTKELQDVLHGRGGLESDAEDIVIQIERTTQLVDNYEAKASKLDADKWRRLTIGKEEKVDTHLA